MKSKTLAQIGEDALVRSLTQNLPLGTDVIAGAGDDCAIVKPLRKGWLQLLKTDCVVEGVHFLSDTPPERIGWKAMARAISDIGAMGGTPQHALITLLAPPDRKVSEIKKLYAGLWKCAAQFGVSIVGGETSRAPMLAVVVSLTGTVRASHCVKRDGAKAGDLIFVTSRLGGSLRGQHLNFMPRVAEAQWLAENLKPHAMMDLSDGLAKDLPRMAAASGVDFVIFERTLPLNEGCTFEQAWSDGEDYELLFTFTPRSADALTALNRGWKKEFPKTWLTAIGRIVSKGKGRAPSFAGKGWEHFKK